jgi:hypothetical protein
MVKHANMLLLIKRVNTARILILRNMFVIIKYAGTLGIIKHANTVARIHTYAYRNLVTTLNFPCSVQSPISVHWEMGEAKAREETDVSLSAVT